jgi:chromosome segregation protein
LEESLEEKSTQLNVSYQKLEAAQARIRALEQSEVAVLNQAESFECTIKDLSAKNVSLNEIVAQFQSDLQSKEAELINLRSMTQNIALLESRLQDVGGETAQMSRIIDEKTEEIARLEGELARHERQRELDEIRISLQSMQSVNDDLVAKLSDKENLNVDLRKNLENSTQRFDLLHSKLESVQSEKSSLSERVRLLESQLECQEAKNVNLNQMVAQFQSDIQSKEAELINLRSMTQTIALLESRLQDVGGETAQMTRIIDGKTDEIARLEEELARATESQRNHQTQLQHADQRFQERQRELNEIRISLQSMQSLNDDLVAKLSEKENLNGDLRKNLENGTQRFELLHSKLELVQSEKSSLAERVRLLESQLECQEQEIGDLRQGLSEVHNERGLSTQLKQRLNSLQAQYDDAVSQCQQLATSNLVNADQAIRKFIFNNIRPKRP